MTRHHDDMRPRPRRVAPIERGRGAAGLWRRLFVSSARQRCAEGTRWGPGAGTGMGICFNQRRDLLQRRGWWWTATTVAIVISCSFFKFCWNYFRILLEPFSRFAATGEDSARRPRWRGAMFFAAQDFCWNQIFVLLQSVRMVLGQLRRRRQALFAALISFAGNPFFQFCWNYMTFLLELCLLFVGTISTCFARKI